MMMLTQIQTLRRFGTRAAASFACGLMALTFNPVRPAFAQSASALPLPGPDIAGLWIDHTQQGAVEIKPCGTAMCGYIAWIKKPTDARGQPIADGNNPDPARRSTPLCGLQIIGDLSKPATGMRYNGGWIYNPEDGGKFDVDVRPVSKDQLEVHGFLGIRLLGESFIWRRAPPNQERCKV
jgi:uncharacterized protein (DUF2147 family)